jgi:predicted metal-binding membrane protein
MPSVDAVVRRRSAVTSGLLLLVALCWAWIIAMALDMYGRMTGPASWMMTTSWDAAHVSLLFAIWNVMMAGMMLPSAAPAITQYANVLRDDGLFSAVATIVQRAITEGRLLNPMMEPAMPLFAGGLLLVSGKAPPLTNAVDAQGIPWSDTNDIGPTAGATCDQDRLEPILRAHAERRGADIRFNIELVDYLGARPVPS